MDGKFIIKMVVGMEEVEEDKFWRHGKCFTYFNSLKP